MPQLIQDLLGAQQPRGYTGSVGFTGSIGDTGFTGSVGFTGSDGFTGSVGFTGSIGVTGFTGSVGFTGSRGSLAPKSISIIDPTSAEDITLFYTDVALTITGVEAVLRGAATPSVTLILRYSNDRNAVGTGIIASTAVTNTTTGQAITVTSGSVPAGNFVWLETTAVSGTVNELHVSILI